MDDKTIVDLYLSRDEEAIVKTSEKYGHRLLALAQNIVDDLQTAEECVNDTYLDAWNSIPPHEPRDYLFPFLARITRHIALNRCKMNNCIKRSAHICELSSEMEQCIPDTNDSGDYINSLALSEAINNFLSTLNEEKRNIFIRRYWYMDSIEDISNLFSLSPNKIKSILFRCRNKLRIHLTKGGFNV